MAAARRRGNAVVRGRRSARDLTGPCRASWNDRTRRRARRTAPSRRSRPRSPRRLARRPPSGTGRPSGPRFRPRRTARRPASSDRTRTRIASTSCASVTVTISSTRRRLTSNVSAPGVVACSPSAIVRGTPMSTRSPAASDRRVSSPASGSTPTTRIPGAERLRRRSSSPRSARRRRPGRPARRGRARRRAARAPPSLVRPSRAGARKAGRASCPRSSASARPSASRSSV